jgi:hypothetical protein
VTIPLLRIPVTTTFTGDDALLRVADDMSWALKEFFAAIDEEFGVAAADSDETSLQTPGEVIDFVVENTEPTDGMDADEYRDHVAGVVGEIMARTLGVTRYDESSHFVQDLHIR